ncbi:MAG: leucine-rich repeat protein [Acutalibacteraceae bacterium]
MKHQYKLRMLSFIMVMAILFQLIQSPAIANAAENENELHRQAVYQSQDAVNAYLSGIISEIDSDFSSGSADDETLSGQNEISKELDKPMRINDEALRCGSIKPAPEAPKDAEDIPVLNSAEDNGTASAPDAGKPSSIASGVSIGYQGAYNQITWIFDTSTGELTISGSGAVYANWYDNYGNSFASSIKKITIHQGITSIEDYAFTNCTAAASVSIPYGVTKIGYGAFAYCGLTSVAIPDSVTSIGDYAFYFCSNLNSVHISENASTIGEYAFNSCSNLQSVNLPQTLTGLGAGVFANCQKLQSVSVPPQCKTIPVVAFYGCTSLADVELSEGLSVIEDNAFTSCEKLTKINIPSTVTDIGFGAFGMCSALTEATIYGNLAERAFLSCVELTKVQLMGNCTSLGVLAFGGCRKLEAAGIPNGVETVADFAFYACQALKSLSFPDGVRSIGTSCFGGDEENGYCTSLEYVRLPASLQSLGGFAFEKCSALKTVEMPESFTGGLDTIEQYTFSGCSSLKTVNLPDEIKYIKTAAFTRCSSISSITLPPDLQELGEGAFGICSSLTGISIPASCTTIGTETFFQCSSLTDVTLSDSTTAIGDAAFYECTSLTSIQLPDTLETLGTHVFAGCEALEKISLPDSVLSAGKYCFANCTSLTEVKLSDKMTSIHEGIFLNCTALSDMVLNDSVNEICDYAFYDCRKLSELSLPVNLSILGKGIFIHCISLSHMTLPSQITLVPEATFLSCENLTSVNMDGEITEIGDYAFTNCARLEKADIDDSVTKIGIYGFANCEILKNINLPEGLVSVGELAFANCNGVTQIDIPASVEEIGDCAFAGMLSLNKMSVASGNCNYLSENNILYSADKSKLIYYPITSEKTEFTIPSTVTSLASAAFYGCENLKKIVISSGIKEIPDRAFYGCSALEDLVLPDGTTNVGNYAFSQCVNLKKIYLPDTITDVGYGTFIGDIALTEVSLPDGLDEIQGCLFCTCESLEFVDIPDSVTKIGKYAFAWCSALEEIKLPASLSELGEAAFTECPLSEIIIPVGVEYIDSFVFNNCKKLQSVSLEGAVFAIGNYAFTGAESLQEVSFAGDAPETVGTDAFSGTNSELTLYYVESASGWTFPHWTGPDGLEYKTATSISGVCGENLRWSLSTHTGTLTVSGTGDMYSWSDENNVPWNQYRDIIKSVVIHNGVTSLGSRAFMGCEYLTKADLPESIGKSGYGVFADCTRLEKVTAENGLQSVGQCMFYNCYMLDSIDFSDKLETVGSYAFYKCTRLTSVKLPEKVGSIPEGAFADCVSLAEVDFSGNVNNIESGAFLNCNSLSILYFGGEIPATVSGYAFRNVPKGMRLFSDSTVETWTDGDGVEHQNISSSKLCGSCSTDASWRLDLPERKLIIKGSGAIDDYESGLSPWSAYSELVDSIEIASGITGIGSYAFENMQYANIIAVPQTVVSIGKYAFANCASVAKLQLPDALVSLGEGAFCGCSSLTEIKLPEKINTIEPYLFNMCVSLEHVDLPQNLNSIGYASFYFCSALEEINLPSGVTEIPDWAFAHCIKIKSLKFPETVTAVGDYAFYDCSGLKDIQLSSSLTSLGAYSLSNTAIASVSLPGRITVIKESAFEQCRSLTEVNLTYNIKEIQDSAFFGCTSLASVDLRCVEKIGEKAFMESGLKSVTLPSSVNTVGDYSFASCHSLKSINSESSAYTTLDGVLYKDGILLQYPAGKQENKFTVPSDITQIASGAFYGSGYLTGVEIGNRVTKLGQTAFAFCDSLQNVWLGKNMTAIDVAAFAECNSLENVYFYGDSPSFGKDAFYNAGDNLILYWKDGSHGWTEGKWTASDGLEYSTVKMPKIVVGIAVKTLPTKTEYEIGESFEPDGLVITVSYDDGGTKDIEYDASSNAITIGEFYSDTAGTKIIKITYENKSADVKVNVKNGNVSDKDKIILTLDENTAKSHDGLHCLTAKAVAGSDCKSSNAVLILAEYDGNRMLRSFKRNMNITPGQSSEEDFYVEYSAYMYKVFLLDADTFAPLTYSTRWSEYLEPDILPDADVSVVVPDVGDIFLSRAAQTPVANVPKGGCEVTPAFADSTADIASNAAVNAIPSADDGSLTIHETEVNIYVSDIEKDSSAIVDGNAGMDTAKETRNVRVSMTSDLGSIGQSGSLTDSALYETSYELTDKDGNVALRTETQIAHCDVSGEAKISLLGGTNEKGGYELPSVSLGGSAKYEVISAGAELKDWDVLGIKVKTSVNAAVGGVGAEGGIEINKEGFTIGSSAGVDAADAGGTISICDKYGNEVIAIELGVGVGASAKASAEVGKDKITLKAGAKIGLGGTVGVTFRPVNIVKALLKIYFGEQLQQIRDHLINLKTIDKNGNVLDQKYLYMRTDEDMTGVEELVQIPLVSSEDLPAAETYSEALKMSAGATQIPAELNPYNPNGGSNIGEAVQGNTSEENKNNISNSVTLTQEQQLKILETYLRGTMLGFPRASIMQAISRDFGSFGMFLDAGMPNVFGGSDTNNNKLDIRIISLSMSWVLRASQY